MPKRRIAWTSSLSVFGCGLPITATRRGGFLSERRGGRRFWAPSDPVDGCGAAGRLRESIAPDLAVVESSTGEFCAFRRVEAGPPFPEVFSLGIVAPAFHGPGWEPLSSPRTSERPGASSRSLPDARMLIDLALADEPKVSALLSSRVIASTPLRAPPRELLRPARAASRHRGIRFAASPGGGGPADQADVEVFADHWAEAKNVRGLPPPSHGRAAVRRRPVGLLPGTERNSRLRRPQEKSLGTLLAATSRCGRTKPYRGRGTGRRSSDAPSRRYSHEAAGSTCMWILIPLRAPRGCTKGWA